MMNTNTTAQQIEATAAELGLSMTAEFVPFSQSRNASEKMPSLNWKITLLVKGRPIITTDYSAGCGHCPSYTQGKQTIANRDAVRFECENGRRARITPGGSPIGTSEKLNPQFADVLSSLVTDGDAIDFPSFEDWASEFGYDKDSRKGEAIYRQCLESGLKLRAALGESGLSTLRDAVSNY
jgi:hypothetical protein